jgi:hypothetical protein
VCAWSTHDTIQHSTRVCSVKQDKSCTNHHYLHNPQQIIRKHILYACKLTDLQIIIKLTKNKINYICGHSVNYYVIIIKAMRNISSSWVLVSICSVRKSALITRVVGERHPSRLAVFINKFRSTPQASL